MASLQAYMQSLCSRPARIAWNSMVQTRATSARGAARSVPVTASTLTPDIEWDDVHNFRDIAGVDPLIIPGRVFRCAAPVQATDNDIKRLYNQLSIKELIDLRSSDELKTIPKQHNVVFDGIGFCKYIRDIATRRAVPDPLSTSMGDSDVMRVHIPPLEKRRLYRSLLARMPLRTAAYVVATSIINKEAGRAAAIEEVNAEGLEGIYEILIDSSKPEWVAALQRVLLAAERSRPVLFFCKAGKDRTGILAALLLSILGATEDQIVADYVKSDAWHHVALAGIEDDSRVAKLDRAKFERAPEEAMRHALRHIRRTYGGVEEYLLGAGLTTGEVGRLRAALLRPAGLTQAKL